MSEQALVAALQQRMATKYAQIPLEHVSEVVRRSYALFAECRVREFIPLLVERRAAAELGRLARVDAVRLSPTG